MTFSYYGKDNNIKRLNIEVGKKWSSYKVKNDNPLLNSVFDAVDKISDGKVNEDESDILHRLLKIADSQIEGLKGNNIIENDELNFLIDKINEYELESLEGNHSYEIVTPKIIDIPNDIDKLNNYEYLSTFIDFGENEDESNDKIKIEKVAVDYSDLRNLEHGKYYVDSWRESLNEDGITTYTPVVRKIQKSNQDGTKNWSEGINRNISKIQFDRIGGDSALLEFMKKVGEEQGFSLELLDGAECWIEDFGVIRADKKQVIPCCDLDFVMRMYDNQNTIIAKRAHITVNKQGNAIQCDKGNTPNAIRYSHTVAQEDIIQGKTYLEGGNVLNTLTKNGEPAAIIGEESIQYTMCAMLAAELGDTAEAIEKTKQIIKDNSEEYVYKAKKLIAQELGLKEENITYIPQFDFHIDMHYRPLNNGQIGIPDYEAGINILKDLIHKIDNQQENHLQNKKQEYLKLINKLEELETKTKEIAKSAEDKLIKQGYEIVKIPCFTDIDNGGQGFNKSSVENAINFMNGICGTSAKTNDKFYITNTSGDKILDDYMEKYFIENVGFDKVYFAPTKDDLSSLGGIDCLTKEF